jgi:hypothetical protein
MPADAFASLIRLGHVTLDRAGSPPLLRELETSLDSRATPIPSQDLVISALVKTSCDFAHSFQEGRGRLLFRDSQGRHVSCKYFGVDENSGGMDSFRGQVRVLYCDYSDERRKLMRTFIVDLSKQSTPFQVVAACIERKATFREMLEDMRSKMAQWSPQPDEDRLGPRETLAVPEMHWRVSHRFRDLEGENHPFLNERLRGQYLREASETIQFTIDRFGATMDAAATLLVGAPEPRKFAFDHPYLVVISKRDFDVPCFVIWADNSELLDK